MAHDFRQPDHLPKVRGDQGADPGELPRQRRGITPQMHGRYPDYDCLEHVEHWDVQTRELVVGRVERVPELRFFSDAEAAALTAFCDVVLAQDAEPRIPVLAFVDEKFAEGRMDGYRYAGMPDDRQTWRLVARGLDDAARASGAASYARAAERVQAEIADSFAEASIAGGAWDELDLRLAWGVVMRSVLAAFYSHPWAWNEIGFGGPAYPRGYARLGIGLSEAWEGVEALDADPVTDVRAKGYE
ncbi:MAG TPA: gluconate 2-dehydrogenase subunit 3 family protein [Gaiellaceae bacterium]|nr:gluconate 2-dehydrogenase subunit 3 family protein [Gaiellaceae bacterium]